jgi:SAM-dependent methyltransferase
METVFQTYNEHAALWDGLAGRAWVAQQPLLDETFERLEDLLVDQVFEGHGTRVLDVGCGAGSTTIAIAEMLGARGNCVGIDVSGPLIAAARERAERERSTASFIRADAETYAFEGSEFDMIVSRFGVMFFENPARAFANIQGSARPGADLRMLVWRSADENPFMTTAERAAAPILGSVPPRPSAGPGQFAFAEPNDVLPILEEGGWRDVSFRRVDVPCSFPASKLVEWVTRLGPLGRVLNEADTDMRERVLETVLPAFNVYVEQDEVTFDAACWLVCAKAQDRRGS